MKKRKILPILLTTAVIAAGAAALIRKPSLRYLAADAVSGLFRTDTMTEINADDLVLETYSLNALLTDEKVTFDQSMLLINSTYPIPSDFEADAAEYNGSGVMMNTCVMEAYRSLAAEISEKFDEKLYIMSAYRTEAEQAAAMESEGEKAAQIGASEHQAGLGLDGGEFWQYEDTIITAQGGDELLLPAEYESITIFPDNRGNYVITVKS